MTKADISSKEFCKWQKVIIIYIITIEISHSSYSHTMYMWFCKWLYSLSYRFVYPILFWISVSMSKSKHASIICTVLAISLVPLILLKGVTLKMLQSLQNRHMPLLFVPHTKLACGFKGNNEQRNKFSLIREIVLCEEMMYFRKYIKKLVKLSTIMYHHCLVTNYNNSSQWQNDITLKLQQKSVKVISTSTYYYQIRSGFPFRKL